MCVSDSICQFKATDICTDSHLQLHVHMHATFHFYKILFLAINSFPWKLRGAFFSWTHQMTWETTDRQTDRQTDRRTELASKRLKNECFPVSLQQSGSMTDRGIWIPTSSSSSISESMDAHHTYLLEIVCLAYTKKTNLASPPLWRYSSSDFHPIRMDACYSYYGRL